MVWWLVAWLLWTGVLLGVTALSSAMKMCKNPISNFFILGFSDLIRTGFKIFSVGIALWSVVLKFENDKMNEVNNIYWVPLVSKIDFFKSGFGKWISWMAVFADMLGIRKYIVGLIIKISSDQSVAEREKVYLGKLNMILVQVSGILTSIVDVLVFKNYNPIFKSIQKHFIKES